MRSVIAVVFVIAGVTCLLATAWLPASLNLSMAAIWWVFREDDEDSACR